MEQRVSLITLGASDIERGHAFYRALGWSGESRDDPDGHPWEVAHNPGWRLGTDRSTNLH